MNEAGIPWSDPRIQEWIDSKLDVAIATDPTIPTRYQAPPLFSPYEIRQQQIEANRVDITGNDLRQGANEFLAAITYGPALVLWEAAHDRGDHSGAEIAWAAAELGLNVVGIVPGVGALTGVAAKATVRRLAPEFWGVLSATDDVVDAVRAGQALQDARVTNSALDYRQKFVLNGRPSPAANAIDNAPSPLPSDTSPGPAMAPELHTTVSGLPAATASRPVHLAEDFTPTPAAVNSAELPLNQIRADEGAIAQAAKNFVADVEHFVMLEARMPVTAMAGTPGRGAAAAGDGIPARPTGSSVSEGSGVNSRGGDGFAQSNESGRNLNPKGQRSEPGSSEPPPPSRNDDVLAPHQASVNDGIQRAIEDLPTFQSPGSGTHTYGYLLDGNGGRISNPYSGPSGNETIISGGTGLAPSDAVSRIIRASPISQRIGNANVAWRADVEMKVAAIMKSGNISDCTLVINNPAGPCPGCAMSLPYLLSPGSTLRVVWPSGSAVYRGVEWP
ncbi:DddA-like double-stranded DNA deaminase toxin [Nocardia sp. NPDC058658]|uniref:DddA-like double-stranded DNA deaminase toxin n=1 Tax=Nocardia sp. NPDC058658 TaxID=3346580 RepID=UPI003666B956